MKKRRLAILLTIISILSFILVGCGDDEPDYGNYGQYGDDQSAVSSYQQAASQAERQRNEHNDAIKDVTAEIAGNLG